MGDQENNSSKPAVLILDVKKAVPVKRFDVSPTFTAMALSPNGRLLAIGNADGKVDILRVED
jgi:hypothetical protein